MDDIVKQINIRLMHDDISKHTNKFVELIENNIMNIELFSLACDFKDLCMKKFNYCPYTNENNQLISQWIHKETNRIIKLDAVRYILTTYLAKRIDDIVEKYMIHITNFNHNDIQFINLNRKISKLIELTRFIRKGKLYKEFVDLFKNGYLV
jgi:hypothetical protein